MLHIKNNGIFLKNRRRKDAWKHEIKKLFYSKKYLEEKAKTKQKYMCI